MFVLSSCRHDFLNELLFFRRDLQGNAQIILSDI